MVIVKTFSNKHNDCVGYTYLGNKTMKSKSHALLDMRGADGFYAVNVRELRLTNWVQ